MLEGEVDVEAQGGDVVDDVDAEKKEKQKILGLSSSKTLLPIYFDIAAAPFVRLFFAYFAQIVCI